MERSISFLAIGLIFGAGIGFLVAAGNGITLDGHGHADPAAHDHSDPAQHADGMAHDDAAAHDMATMAHAHDETLDLPAGDAAPRLGVQVTPDPASGWNLQVTAENFRFAPENASTSDAPGEGHAHVYVNGTKIARLYGEWMHLATLPEGEVAIEVSLSSNGHKLITVDGVPVSATVTLQN